MEPADQLTGNLLALRPSDNISIFLIKRTVRSSTICIFGTFNSLLYIGKKTWILVSNTLIKADKTRQKEIVVQCEPAKLVVWRESGRLFCLI